MPNGHESDAQASPNEPQADVWASDPLADAIVEQPQADARLATPIRDAARPILGTPIAQGTVLRGTGLQTEPEPSIDVSQLPALPPVPDAPPADLNAPPGAEDIARWQAAIADLEREAKAIGNEPHAAALYVEIGRIWEEQLAKPRNAAMAYQRAFHLNARDPSVLH